MENTDLNELAPPDADRTATALPSSSSSVGGAAAVEANVPLPASNKSNPMNSNSSSNDDMLDPDIDIAAEQIVNEFASHLSKDAAIFDNKDIMDDDDDIKEGDEVGVMSHSLAAGGFEELIAAFDEEEEEEVEEEVEEEEEHTEEIVDESYEEEEITEEEIIESDEIKEIILNPMENSNIITEDSARSAQSRKIHVIHPDVEMNIDAAEDMVVDDDCPNQGPPVVEPAVDDVSENQATSVGASGSINNSVGGSSSVNKHSDGIPMELSPASLSSAQKSIAGSMVSEKTDGPSGDALLGDMSELSAQSSQHGSFRNNQSERSTASVKSLKSMFSNKSTRSQASAAQQSLKSYQSSQKTPSVAHSTSAQSKESTNSSQRFTAVPPATAAIVASVAAESMGSDATDTIPQDAARHAPGRDPSGTAAGLIPVEQATSGIDPDVDATEQDYEEVEIDDSEVMEEEIEELKVEEKEDHELEKGEDQDSKVERQTYETPIPPGMGGMTSVEDAAPSQEIDPYKDLELGGPIATNAEDRAKQESATDSKQPVEPVEIERSSRTPLLITGVICFVVIMAIILSVVLTQGNDSDRGDVPTFPPSPGQAPGIAPPAQAPNLAPIATPPTLLTWTEVIPPIGGPPASNFGSAVGVDSNLFAVGAPLYQETGAVFTSVLSSDGNWETPAPLLGEQPGDSFGRSVDVVGQYVVVGAPMRSIANTSTPAGAAYVFSYSPNDGAWQQIGLAMRSMEGILEANGDFGASVALGLSTSQRVVIGAPKSSSAVDALQGGRVYSFESSGSEWNSLEASPIYGKNAYDWFGASVDMSKDGSRFIVGAPGNMSDSPGYFRTYVWMDTQWIQEYEGTGVSGEYFGSSVVVLSDEGDLFAVGGPGFSEGSGRVVVYQRQSSGEYLQLGEPLVGLQGERFGSGGSLSGGPFTTGTVVVVGTNTGVVKSFVFDSTAGTWNEQFEALSTSNDSGTGVSVEYSEADGLLVGTSASDMVSLYTTGTTAAPASPTSTPTASTIGTTTAPVSTNTSSVPTTTAPTVSTNTSSVPASGTPVTVAPTVTSLVGTAPPTINAAVPLANWTLTATEFTPQTENSGFGASVSLSSSSMVVGAPQTLGNGGVFIYQKVSGIWETAASGQLFGTEPGGLFGSSVDVVDGFLVVGAPSTVANGTTISVGAAFCYAQINGKWDPLGRTLIGDSGVFGTQEQFGASVSAASATRRVVVGAPGSSLDSIVTRGRVYVFEFTEASSSWTRMFDVSGTTASFALGTSVDMAQDGSQFVVGAPGGGYAEIYEYSGTTWVSAHIVQDTIGGFGSAVAILASNTFAVGAPEANGGQGRVVVYQLNNAGIFAALGTPIEGSTGDRLGATGTVSGSDSATTIVLGTANGSVRRLGYDADTDSWVEISVSVSTEFGTGLRAVSASSQGSVFVVGGTLDAAIYELL